MKKFLFVISFLFLIVITHAQNLQQQEPLNSPQSLEKIGRGLTVIQNKKLITQNAYATFGEKNWKDYEVRFSGRVPDTAKQVQLCAGFRAGNRDDRYILMLKGGNEQFLYLARLGYMGSDDFLAIRKLDFYPTPGKWYNFRIQVVGPRIRVFLNNESVPRIDIKDELTRLAPAGQVTLGGSWIANEFQDLKITPLSEDALEHFPAEEYHLPEVDKIALRRQERKAYQPVQIKKVENGRTTVSLNGRWLFSPGYETIDEARAVSPAAEDSSWHILTVPNFWNPIRVWQHGERYKDASKGVADNYWQKEIDRCEAYTFDYKKTAVGWYRQWVVLPEHIQDKHIELSFDAVSKVAEIWVNGKKAGDHVGMFGDFKLNVSKLLKPGKNLIVVKVVRDYIKNIKDANKVAGVAVTVEVTQKMLKDLAHGFFNDDPAGIWQPVTLTISNPVRIEDVFIKPDLNGAQFQVTVKNYSASPQTFGIATDINGKGFSDHLYKGIAFNGMKLKPGEQRNFTYQVKELKPRLWSPEHPNLYTFKFKALSVSEKVLDESDIVSGFRTFQVTGDYLYLNGKRYWLRGGNQTTMPLAPNDTAMADHFNKLMKAGNIMVTRTHTVPYDEVWMHSSDVQGIGVSYEGTWPWLFLESSMPEPQLIDLWKKEFYDLIKKYRNHPSLLFWTMNNEMKFYDNDPDLERAKLKMHIISDVVKEIRKIDPTRPVVFDSNYKRKTKRFGSDFYKDIDDGDIDDPHAYYNWYDYSIFNFFKGEWQRDNKNPGRPLICQEMSTGYTDETGHPTRYYTYMHQNPASLVGKYAYEYNDPQYFLNIQGFISKELGEALRRSDDKSAGILHFSTLTWFRNVEDVKKIEPWPVYQQMKTALQPVLVSAELWGRHFYAGTKLPTRICVINDREDGTDLGTCTLQWELQGPNHKKLAQGEILVPSVGHYERRWFTPEINIPEELPDERVYGKLVLKLQSNGKEISENAYDLLFAKNPGRGKTQPEGKKIVVLDNHNTVGPALNFLQVSYQAVNSVKALVNQKADLYIVSGLDSIDISPADLQLLKQFCTSGRKLLISQCHSLGHLLYPQFIRGLVKEQGEVANMELPESTIFNNLEPLDIRNFNNNQREIPAVMNGAFRISRDERLDLLASFTKVHGYLSGTVNERMARLDKIKGYPIIKVRDDAKVILSEMALDKAVTDPVAAQLLINMLKDLTD